MGIRFLEGGSRSFHFFVVHGFSYFVTDDGSGIARSPFHGYFAFALFLVSIPVGAGGVCSARLSEKFLLCFVQSPYLADDRPEHLEKEPQENQQQQEADDGEKYSEKVHLFPSFSAKLSYLSGFEWFFITKLTTVRMGRSSPGKGKEGQGNENPYRDLILHSVQYNIQQYILPQIFCMFRLFLVD